ncbi:hypothetical protein CVT24_001284 [Panaeolus cyanescens]|uniref:SET domain-containing protein n=1 Tax=Panaeolus cyanescens TaxID=181874 RepID=A0A409YYX6_9AGAR|nr:hypothetical protein CVT24_001284 [Panaeolus cyanescens]
MVGLEPQYNSSTTQPKISRTELKVDFAEGESSQSRKSWMISGRQHVIHTIHLSSPTGQDSTISCLIDPALIPLLPSPLPDPVQTYDGEPNFVIKQSPRIDINTMQNEEIGLGIYASRFIPAGTLIAREHPALIVPAGSFPTEAYEEMGNALPEKRRAEMLSMANCYRVKEPKEGEEVVGEVEGIVRTNALVLDLKTPVTSSRKRSRDEEDQIPLAKEVYGGVYPLINRCNHSCGPNAAVKWDLETLSLSLYALRDIEKDEEILKTYADPAHSREKRMQKLFNNYKFSCDCPWCEVQVDGKDQLTREEKIRASDELRDALGSWIFMHPTYKKWSDDLCASDDLVIRSHQEALSLLGVEGMHGLQLFFVEEIALCYAMLGDELQFKKWAAKTIQLSQVENKVTYKTFLTWLEDPPRKMAKWGWRKNQREQKARKKRHEIECEDDNVIAEGSMRFFLVYLCQIPTHSAHPRQFEFNKLISTAMASVSASRLAALTKLRCSIFQTSYNPQNLRTGAKYLRSRLRGPSMVAYYPDQFNIPKIIRQYPELEMVNEDEEERLQDVIDRKKRGKGAPKKAKTKSALSHLSYSDQSNFVAFQATSPLLVF